MNTMKESQRELLKDKLLEEKRQLENHFDLSGDSEEHGTMTDSTGELSSYDNHPAEIATETSDRERDMAIDKVIHIKLDEVNLALERIDKGTYGRCEVCGIPIPFERLQAIPSTSYCKDHTPDRSIADDRPVEEQVMTPPPSGAGVNRQRHAGRFDDADAWKSLESYGDSDSGGSDTKEG
jgi:YteA family regulatory protein